MAEVTPLKQWRGRTSCHDTQQARPVTYTYTWYYFFLLFFTTTAVRTSVPVFPSILGSHVRADSSPDKVPGMYALDLSSISGISYSIGRYAQQHVPGNKLCGHKLRDKTRDGGGRDSNEMNWYYMRGIDNANVNVKKNRNTERTHA